MTEVIDSRAFSEFCGVDSSNQVPDGDTIRRFRALLAAHGLQEKLFGQVVNLLSVRGLILKKGTIAHVPEGKSSAESMRSHRFGPRSSTFLRLSKGCSNIARPDTEAFENRSPN